MVVEDHAQPSFIARARETAQHRNGMLQRVEGALTVLVRAPARGITTHRPLPARQRTKDTSLHRRRVSCSQLSPHGTRTWLSSQASCRQVRPIQPLEQEKKRLRQQ